MTTTTTREDGSRTLADVGATAIFDAPSGRRRVGSDGVPDAPTDYAIVGVQEIGGQYRYAVRNRHTGDIDVTRWGSPECTYGDAISDVGDLPSFEG